MFTDKQTSNSSVNERYEVKAVLEGQFYRVSDSCKDVCSQKEFVGNLIKEPTEKVQRWVCKCCQ